MGELDAARGALVSYFHQGTPNKTVDHTAVESFTAGVRRSGDGAAA